MKKYVGLIGEFSFWKHLLPGYVDPMFFDISIDPEQVSDWAVLLSADC